MQSSIQKRKKLAKKIIVILKKNYVNAWTTLIYSSNFELLISVILSAQATDAQINKLTPALFAKYPNAKSMAKAPSISLQKLVRSSGFYKTKAKNIKKTAKLLMLNHSGKVPSTMEELTALAGVARKTANIILYHCFSKNEGIAVDTHCMRLSYRFGIITSRNNQNKIEKELMQIVDKKYWGMYTNWMVLHGRNYCTARNPKCDICPLNLLCNKTGL